MYAIGGILYVGRDKENFWYKFADSWDEKNEYFSTLEYITDVKHIIERQKDLGNLLEIGCGNGYYTEDVACNANSVTATDFADEMVSCAMEKLAGNPKIIVEKADCLNLQYPDESFDSVLMVNVLPIVRNPQRALAEVNRMLKSEGVFINFCPTTERMKHWEVSRRQQRFLETFGMPPYGFAQFKRNTLEDLITSAGFCVEEKTIFGEIAKGLFFHSQKP